MAGEIVAVKNVIAKYQHGGLAVDKLPCNDQGVRQAIRRRLNSVLNVQPPLMAVLKKMLEPRRILGRRDHENIPRPCQHERAERIVNHRLVVDRQQLLRNRLGHRVQTRAGTAGKDDSLTPGLRARRNGTRSSPDIARW